MACRSHHLHPTRPDRPRPRHPLHCQFGLACLVSAGRRREHPTRAGPGQGRGRAACDRDGAVRSRPLPPVPGNQHQRDPHLRAAMWHYCHQADDAATEAMLEAKHFGPGSRFDLEGDAASPTTGANRATCFDPRNLRAFLMPAFGPGLVAATRAGQMEELSSSWSHRSWRTCRRRESCGHASDTPPQVGRPWPPSQTSLRREPSCWCLAPAMCGTGSPPASRWPVGPAGLAVGAVWPGTASRRPR